MILMPILEVAGLFVLQHQGELHKVLRPPGWRGVVGIGLADCGADDVVH